MRFNFEEYTLEPEILNRETKESKHTGKQLEILNISFESNKEFEKPEFIYSEDKKWKVINSSYSYTQGNTITTYNWKIEEIEELKIAKLIIDDLEFEPYLYYEEIEETKGDALLVNAIIETTVEIWQNIKSSPSGKFFSVIRQGISDEEKEMRFGRILWSKHEDTIKCGIVLVEKIYDEYANPFIGVSQPEKSNIKENLLKTSEKIDRLLSLLVDKGIITSQEQEIIETINKGEMDFSIFNKVEDLDKFLKDSDQLEKFEKC